MGLLDFLRPNRSKRIHRDISGKSQGDGSGKQTSHDFFSFLKELAKYYMSFLETDFHKERRPRRYIPQTDRFVNL